MDGEAGKQNGLAEGAGGGLSVLRAEFGTIFDFHYRIFCIESSAGDMETPFQALGVKNRAQGPPKCAKTW